MGRPSSRANAPPDVERIGERYRVARELGRGAMAVVYEATDSATDRAVALKLLLQVDRERVRFRREYHTLASLKHPRIVEVYDYGVHEDAPYYTMELLDTRDLVADAPMNPQRVCAVLRDVAAALAVLHSRGLVHRDVSSRNVRFTSDGTAKLIDFGILGTPGSSGELVGSLPYVAPELAAGAPIDHRADLFSLGTLGYRLLTGRHPYRVGQFSDLLHLDPAPRPGKLRPETPPLLDELLIAMLNADPAARPVDAAEIVDRATAAGGLEPLPEHGVARAHLESASLIGRKAEIEVARKLVANVPGSGGASLLLTGITGAGKTRLLREVELEAQLAGLLPLRARCRLVASEPFDTARALAAELIAKSPDLVARFPAPEEQLGLTRARPRRRPRDVSTLAEHRANRTRAIAEWFLSVAEERPLALLVDDLQRCDDGSAAVLATLAAASPHHPILLASTWRDDDEPPPPGALDSVLSCSQAIRLRALTTDEISDLVRQIVGNTPNVASLTAWLTSRSGGSPMECTELLRMLIDTGAIRYQDGLWSIREDFDQTLAPASLRDTLDARIASLSAAARQTSELLAVSGGRGTLQHLVTVASTAGLPESDVFEALDELIDREVVHIDADSFELRHDGLIDALLRGIPPERLTMLHREIGTTLLAERQAEDRDDAVVGWHLVRGGEILRGAELLARAGRRLVETAAFGDAIAPLETAVEALAAEGRDDADLLEIRFLLIMAGFYSDPEVVQRHAPRAIAAAEPLSGIALIRRLQPRIGMRLGLVLGIALHTVRSLFRLRRRGPGPLAALRQYVYCVTYTAAVAAMRYDLPQVRELLTMVEPFAATNLGNVQGAWVLTRALVDATHGRLARTATHLEAFLAALPGTARVAKLSSSQLLAMYRAGALLQLILVAIRRGDPRTGALMEELRAIPLSVAQASALLLRMLHHRWRGEAEQADRLYEATELAHIRAGGAWQLRTLHSIMAAPAHCVFEDTMRVKRSLADVSELAKLGLGAGVQAHVDILRGEYLRLRGDPAAAVSPIERGLDALPPDEGSIREWGLLALAEARCELGELDNARLIAEKSLASATDPVRDQAILAVATSRTLARIDCRSGKPERAAKRLGDALDRASAMNNPGLAGLLHEERARVAELAGDDELTERHRRHAQELYRSCDFAAGLARLEQLTRRPSTGGCEAPDRATTTGGRLARSPEDERDLPTAVGRKRPPPGR